MSIFYVREILQVSIKVPAGRRGFFVLQLLQMLAYVIGENLVVVVVVMFLRESRASVELGDYPGDEVPIQIHLCVEIARNLR